jgi:hypothetical protein
LTEDWATKTNASTTVTIILIVRDRQYRQVLQYALLDELLVAGLVHVQEVKFVANAEEGWEREKERREKEGLVGEDMYDLRRMQGARRLMRVRREARLRQQVMLRATHGGDAYKWVCKCNTWRRCIQMGLQRNDCARNNDFPVTNKE